MTDDRYLLCPDCGGSDFYEYSRHEGRQGISIDTDGGWTYGGWVDGDDYDDDISAYRCKCCEREWTAERDAGEHVTAMFIRSLVETWEPPPEPTRVVIPVARIEAAVARFSGASDAGSLDEEHEAALAMRDILNELLENT
jgi:hypothetical protein